MDFRDSRAATSAGRQVDSRERGHGTLDELRYDPSSETTRPPTPEETARAGAEAAIALAEAALQETLVQRNIRRLRHRLTT
ncbi:hypothetical protein [Actinomadura sp. NPDC000600]|uniref:hypothetical protein n=1 Tax=Actinomadura sp. NPDC000600 TaxID=3154262 RepID=UPI003395A3DA